jgi:hypothetical protein
MNIVWGLVLILFTLILCWLGQVINAIAPNFATKIGLAEPEADVDPTYFIDGRGEAIWDALILWVLPVAGILLLIDNPAWVYFGLVGGGIYLYFSGRGLVVRQLLLRRDIPIGKPETVKLYTAVLILWGLIALVTLGLAIAAITDS